jgi:tetratricopeptide (TPR) repeat protein
MIHYRAARFARCVDDAKRALQLSRAARDDRGMRTAMTAVAGGLTKIGRYVEARRYCEQGLRAAEQAADKDNIAACLNNLALVESQCGFPEKAVPLYERALVLTRGSGDRSGVIAQLNNISAAHIAAGAPARALPYLDEGLRLVDEAGFVAQRSYFLANLAQASFDLGDFGAARRWAEEGLESVRRGSDRSSEPGCLILLGRTAQAQGDLDAARRLLREGAKVAAAMQLRRFMVRAVLAYAALCLGDGRPTAAARLLGSVCTSGQANSLEVARAKKLLAEAHALSGTAAEAIAGAPPIGLDDSLAEIAAGTT